MLAYYEHSDQPTSWALRSQTRHAMVTLERVAACVALGEPVLLVGETGTGKTTAVQHLAALLGQTLLVYS